MKLIKLLVLFFCLTIILNSCASFSEVGKVLRNEKTSTNDEFLIGKKKPLTQPPDYDIIPEPGSIKNQEASEQNSIKKILKTTQSKSNNSQTKPKSTEKSILNKIKK